MRWSSRRPGAGDGDGRGRAGAPGHATRGRASHRQDLEGRRVGDTRRRDARRASDCGTYPWVHHLDDAGAGRWKDYDVVIHCSLRAPGMLTPPVVAEFNRSFKVVRALPCDVPLGDHPAQYACRRSTRLQAVAPTPSLTRRTVTSKPTSRRRCSARRSIEREVERRLRACAIGGEENR